MHYSPMSVEEAAAYLHLDMREINKLIQKKEIPYETVRGQIIFRRNHLRDWSTQRILAFKEQHLNDFHIKAHRQQEAPDRHQPFLTSFIEPQYFIDDIPVKSKNKVLKFLADRAFDTGCVCDGDELYSLLVEREELCPTGIGGGVAMPHTRVHSEYLFLENFVLIARTHCAVPFGSIDGKLTDLFFLPCTMDDKLHLYTISRLALMIQKTDLADKLRTAATSNEMYEVFVECEQEFVEKHVKD